NVLYWIYDITYIFVSISLPYKMKNLKVTAVIFFFFAACQLLIAQSGNGIASPGNASNQNQTPGCITPTADLFIFCDGSTPTTASFDFNNAGQTQFHYSYTVDGGPPVTGTFNAPSNYTVTGLTPGQDR